MSTFLLIAGVLLLSAGVVFAFRSATSGVAFSYLGIMALYDSRYVAIDSNLVLFWALGVLIVLSPTSGGECAVRPPTSAATTLWVAHL